MEIKKTPNAPSPWGTWTPSNAAMPESTPNDIQIQSTVFPQFTGQTDRLTDRKTDRPTDEIGDKPVPTPVIRSIV